MTPVPGAYYLIENRQWQAHSTCTIITTSANHLLEPIHNRMPAIIPADIRAEWLDPENQDEKRILSLLSPYAAEDMEAYYVSQNVNFYRNDSPDNIRPVMAEGDA